jgi:hypothetical protein
MPDTIMAGGHSPANDWAGELTDLESRADISSLEGLQQERRQLLREYAPLKALHGNFGKFDNKRKSLLEACKIRARMEMQQKNEKTTEAAVDALGHADPQYIAFIDEGIVGATRYIELETAVTEIEERIRNREICMLAYNSELKLAR